MKRHLRINFDVGQNCWGDMVEVAVVACGRENIPWGSSTTDVHSVDCKSCLRTEKYEQVCREQAYKEIHETNESVGAGGRI